MRAAPSPDYQVSFRTRENIANVALAWRQAGGIYNAGYFDITAFVENILIKRFTRKGVLKIEFFEAGPGDDPAFVTYKPLILHIDSETWQLAKMGDPKARHVIAHEIGHIILHDNDAKAFSNDPSQKISFAPMVEYRAEWQANTFAEYFLTPDHVVRAFGDARSLAAHCSVPEVLAQERSATVDQSARRSRSYTGEACRKCSNFTLVRIGLLQRCDTCDTMIDEFGNILETWGL